MLGYAVSISGDTALVGAMGDLSAKGAAYVFTRSGATWSQQQKLTAADGEASDWFGGAVAVAGDTALVAAYGDDVGANANQGSVYVFTRSGSTWSQQQKLTAADGAALDDFGFRVALAGDTALIGAMSRGRRGHRKPGSGVRLLSLGRRVVATAKAGGFRRGNERLLRAVAGDRRRRGSRWRVPR
jgi:hypothetical protein